MLDDNNLRILLRKNRLSRREKVLLILAADEASPKDTSEIKEKGKSAGLRSIKTWKISDVLRSQPPLVVLVEGRWSLTIDGMNIVRSLVGAPSQKPATTASAALRSILGKIPNERVRTFLEEAIGCLEAPFLRAAVVLSWVGAVAVMQEHVIKNHLATFNAEALRRNAKWKTAKTADDLTLMKEADFLDILEAISILGKSVKKQLLECLDLRNGCGHPNTLTIGPNRVASHIETLILNVFIKF